MVMGQNRESSRGMVHHDSIVNQVVRCCVTVLETKSSVKYSCSLVTTRYTKVGMLKPIVYACLESPGKEKFSKA